MKTKISVFLALIIASFQLASAGIIIPGDSIGGGIVVGPVDDVTKVYIHEQQALQIAKEWYGNRTDVDYYIGASELIDNDYESNASELPDSSAWVRTGHHWLIVVDEHPNQNWSHECGYVYVQCERSRLTATRSCRVPGRMLPNGVNLRLTNSRNLYGNNASLKPTVAQSVPNYNTEVAGKTFALIINSASSRHDNLERYWNDCSFIYKVLTNKYNVMTDNIRILMPTDSLMRKADGSGYTSLPRNIGTDIWNLNINTLYDCLDEIKIEMNGTGHLLVFITGNAGTDDSGEPYILLQGGNRMTAGELERMISSANVRVTDYVLGVSNASAFSEYLSGKGHVITAATGANEAATSYADKPFSEFLMHWTAAMCGSDALGNSVASDSDGNGRMTLEEAFAYADSLTTSTTGDISTVNRYLKEDVAFNNIPEGVDLYIRDNLDDTGKEPSSGRYYTSPDIWYRNNADGLTYQFNQPIEIQEESGLIYLYTRIWNRGMNDYNNNNQYIHYYYAYSPISTAKTFLGGTRDVSFELDGGELAAPKTIGDFIKADSCIIYQKQVFIDEDMSLHKDIFGRLNMNTLQVISNVKTAGVNLIDSIKQGFAAVQAKNNIAQLNKRFYFPNGRDTTIFVHISDSILSRYTFDGIEQTLVSVTLEMSDHAYELWAAHGSTAHNVTASPANPKLFHINGNDSYLRYYNDLQNDSIKITCSYLPENLDEPTEFNLLMEKRDDTTNELLTGAEFAIIFGQESSPISLAPQIDCSLENGEYTLKETAITDDATYNWIDNDGNIIGSNQTIVVDADKARGTYTLKVKSKDNISQGFATIKLDNIPIIESITPNPFDDELNIKLSRTAAPGTEIVVTGITVPNIQTVVAVTEGESAIKIYSGGYPAGSYAVSVVENGVTLGYKKVVKK